MATVPFPNIDQTAATISNNKFCIVSFIPNGVNIDTGTGFSGADSTTSVPKFVGVLCTLVDGDAVSLEPLVNEVYKATGKNDLRFVSKNAKIPEFSFNFEAGEIRTLQAMTGKNASSSTANTFVVRPDFGPSGHIIVQYWTLAGGLQKSLLIPNLSMKIGEVPTTGGVGDHIMQKVTFYREGDGEIFLAMGSKSFAPCGWKTNAINAAAPNGVLTEFIIGEGNIGSGYSVTSPVPLKIEDEYITAKYGASATDLSKYMFGVWLDGVLQTDAQVTYTSGTRKLTFTAAPTNGAALLALYVCDFGSVLPETWTNGPSLPTAPAMWKYQWNLYE